LSADVIERRFNLLLMAKGTRHYANAGQKTLAEEPRSGMAMAVDLDRGTISGVVEQVHVPPGCDEHCIGTLFIREV
jgi:hypothetical protein